MVVLAKAGNAGGGGGGGAESRVKRAEKERRY